MRGGDGRGAGADSDKWDGERELAPPRQPGLAEGSSGREASAGTARSQPRYPFTPLTRARDGLGEQPHGEMGRAGPREELHRDLWFGPPSSNLMGLSCGLVTRGNRGVQCVWWERMTVSEVICDYVINLRSD